MAVEELDNVLYNLYMCEKSLDNWVEVDELLMMFEANTPGMEETLNANTEVKEESTSYLRKAINALKAMISKIISTIKNTIGTLFLSKEDKEAFRMFKEQAQKDPAFANKTITLKDFRNYQAQYSELNARAEKADALLANGQDCDLSKLFGDCETFVKSTGSLVGASVLMTAVENVAYGNQTFANLVYQRLQMDDKLLRQLEGAVGQKATKKFQKNMKAISKRTLLVKMRYQLNSKMYGNLQQTMKATTAEIRKEADALRDLMAGKGVVKNGMKLLAGKNSRRILAAGMQDEEIRNGAKTIYGTVQQGIGIKNSIAGKDTRSRFQKDLDYTKSRGRGIIDKITGEDRLRRSNKYTNNTGLNNAIDKGLRLSSKAKGLKNMIGF